MAEWTAEITTDPLRDHRLYVELLEDDEFRARLYKDDEGQIQLRFYGGESVAIPMEWLHGIYNRYSDDMRNLR